MIEVNLSPFEQMQAATVGIMRQIQNLRAGRVSAYGSGQQNDWQLHIEGALGEMAAAKALGLYWNGNIGNLNAADVGGLQIRTRSKHHYDLILHDRDDDDAAYILVTGVNGSYRLVGWIMGWQGKNTAFWNDPAGGRPAYFVPQNQLSPMTELMQLVVADEGHHG